MMGLIWKYGEYLLYGLFGIIIGYIFLPNFPTFSLESLTAIEIEQNARSQGSVGLHGFHLIFVFIKTLFNLKTYEIFMAGLQFNLLLIPVFTTALCLFLKELKISWWVRLATFCLLLLSPNFYISSTTFDSMLIFSIFFLGTLGFVLNSIRRNNLLSLYSSMICVALAGFFNIEAMLVYLLAYLIIFTPIFYKQSLSIGPRKKQFFKILSICLLLLLIGPLWSVFNEGLNYFYSLSFIKKEFSINEYVDYFFMLYKQYNVTYRFTFFAAFGILFIFVPVKRYATSLLKKLMTILVLVSLLTPFVVYGDRAEPSLIGLTLYFLIISISLEVFWCNEFLITYKWVRYLFSAFWFIILIGPLLSSFTEPLLLRKSLAQQTKDYVENIVRVVPNDSVLLLRANNLHVMMWARHQQTKYKFFWDFNREELEKLIRENLDKGHYVFLGCKEDIAGEIQKGLLSRFLFVKSHPLGDIFCSSEDRCKKLNL